uniref:Methyltransferase FkbM domain-containing protein n=1 Tax=viral metagenome TaxID=1070528 RepID=A0A6C0EKD8_9ZZZZ
MFTEVPEQIMSYCFIKPNHKVLEIGGNIGRNSMIISSCLNDSSNHVILETNKKNAMICAKNIKKNNFNSKVVPYALSKRKLIQKGWKTIPSNVILKGYKSVKILDIKQLNDKYKIKFNVLVLDCEGAFFYILKDMPEILNGIELIIMENDYSDINHYKYVKEQLLKNNFINICSLDGKDVGADWSPCCNFFFETWAVNDYTK